MQFVSGGLRARPTTFSPLLLFTLVLIWLFGRSLHATSLCLLHALQYHCRINASMTANDLLKPSTMRCWHHQNDQKSTSSPCQMWTRSWNNSAKQMIVQMQHDNLYSGGFKRSVAPQHCMSWRDLGAFVWEVKSPSSLRFNFPTRNAVPGSLVDRLTSALALLSTDAQQCSRSIQFYIPSIILYPVFRPREACDWLIWRPQPQQQHHRTEIISKSTADINWLLYVLLSWCLRSFVSACVSFLVIFTGQLRVLMIG